jgi:hypothetical protein
MDTLIGSKKITVKTISGQDIDLTVSQLTLKQYNEAAAFVDDEFKLASICCGVGIDTIYTVSPDDWDGVRLAVEEVNKRFFDYTDRQQRKLTEKLNSFNEKVLKTVSASVKASSATQPGLQPRAA